MIAEFPLYTMVPEAGKPASTITFVFDPYRCPYRHTVDQLAGSCNMQAILKMQNPIQPYAWGSRTAIADLLGRPAPSDHPQAELWMGAHPKAPSDVFLQDGTHRLDALIRQDPTAFIGAPVRDRFGSRLPFLFKVLAVARPLSIQAHPSQAAAREGFARENAAGISLNAPDRNYRDDQHKPECVCALTPFDALCGFRSPKAMLELLAPVWPASQKDHLDRLHHREAGEAIQAFFGALMQMPPQPCRDLLAHIVNRVASRPAGDAAYRWLLRLSNAYPGDVGILAPLLLNFIRLSPGEALFLPAGRLHAYLDGVAIEVMANSDNVLRGGLTPKHMDAGELLRVLDFNPQRAAVLSAQPVSDTEKIYITQAEEFRLCVLHPTFDRPHIAERTAIGPEILLCTNGHATLHWQGRQQIVIRKGESIYITPTLNRYEIHGSATLYKAGVNMKTRRRAS
ncbi:MAG: mannose-6-phosphate isomerase, class I [Desulfatitalea sp.]|nr:mannose-6-phosphate isomerase, class I [Desulfatitalea sp.]NNK01825.1 mannose-6-phosphate isomerase, class I [Desulfatitalea sp.]